MHQDFALFEKRGNWLLLLCDNDGSNGLFALRISCKYFCLQREDMMWIFATFYFSCLHDQDGGNQRLYQRCLKETCLKKKEPFHSRVFFSLAKVSPFSPHVQVWIESELGLLWVMKFCLMLVLLFSLYL